MTVSFEFVDFAGLPTTQIAQRKANCIFTGPWLTGAHSIAVVIVQNTSDPGTPAAVVGVQFFLSVAGGPANPIGGGQLGATSLNRNECVAIPLSYVPQGTDAGSDTLYAQIQSGGGPYPAPTDLTQSINASKPIVVPVGQGDPPLSKHQHHHHHEHHHHHHQHEEK